LQAGGRRGEAVCEAVTKAGFYTLLGYAVTKCEIKGADFPGSILEAPTASTGRTASLRDAQAMEGVTHFLTRKLAGIELISIDVVE
jgi:hypothetical protein